MEKINRQVDTKHIDSSTLIIEVLLQYIRHWKWFVLSIILALFIGLGLILTTTKEYKPSISILLNEDKGSKSASAEYVDLEAIGFLSSTSNIDNEIVVLSSPNLMFDVVKSLYLNITYYQQSLFRETEIYNKTPFLVEIASDVDSFTGACKFNIQKKDANYLITGTYNIAGHQKDVQEIIDKLPYVLNLDANTQLSINLSGENLIEGEKYFVKVNSISSTAYGLASKLAINSASQKSSVLNLSVLINNTQKGIDLLNELVHQYNELNIKLNNEIAFNTSLFINERLKEIAVELSDAETEVVQYKQQNKIADLESEAQLFVTQTGENEKNLMDAETQLNVLRYIQNFIDNPDNKVKIIPNISISDVGLSQIIQEYNNKILASDQLLKGTGEKNPARIRVLEELDNMIGSISASLANVRETHTVTRNDLQRRSYTTQSRIQSVPKQEKGLIEKVREQKIKENLFLFLMQKREETNLSIAATSSKARIVVGSRTDLASVAPITKNILLASLIAGLLLPIIIIYVRNLFRVNISNRDEFQRISNVPIIGEVALNRTDQFVVVDQQQDTIAEMFRSLRNNIRFASAKTSGLTILTTSTIASEGKTFVSINLALSFAYTNKKVLIIGGDIRSPKVHERLGIDSSKSKRGLSDYLITENSDWKSYLITPYTELNNFHILPAGTIPPNPNELLLNLKLKDMLEEAQAEYDYIVIDSAPVGLVSDSYLIGQYVDLTLYVVRENKTPKAAVNFINMQHMDNKLKNMYVVLNGTELTNSYKYGYGKEYGYKVK